MTMTIRKLAAGLVLFAFVIVAALYVYSTQVTHTHGGTHQGSAAPQGSVALTNSISRMEPYANVTDNLHCAYKMRGGDFISKSQAWNNGIPIDTVTTRVAGGKNCHDLNGVNADAHRAGTDFDGDGKGTYWGPKSDHKLN
jgi:hypothetical protein